MKTPKMVSPLNSNQTLKEQIFAILYKFFEEYKNKKHFLCDTSITLMSKSEDRGFPGGAVVESLPANAGDTGSSHGLGRSHMPRSN